MVKSNLCDIWIARLPVNYGADGRYPNLKGILSKKQSCRAFRLVGDTRRFLFLKVPSVIDRKTLDNALRYLQENGIYLLVLNGLRLVKIRFHFFGFSEDDLKHGSLVFLRDNGQQPSGESLLSQLGSVETIGERWGLGSYVERLSLAFAPSADTSITISRARMKRIADVATNQRSVVKGCGAISQSLASKICDVLNIPHTTSVFAIGLSGIRGLVAVYPDDKLRKYFRLGTMNGERLVYRASMEIQKDGPLQVEVYKVSRPPTSSHLSWSIIAQLLSLGVDYKSIKELLELQLSNLRSIISDREQALLYLKNGSSSEDKIVNRELAGMLEAGQRLTEPYLYDRLHRFRNAEYYDLKRKLNIKKSCRLYGIVDEIGVLKDGEVYINLPHREGVVVADVLISTVSQYRPSDVLVLRALDVPELNFLTNCIVFPMKEMKHISECMLGGRLHAEMFFVSWEPSILPTRPKIITCHSACLEKANSASKRQVGRDIISGSNALSKIYLDQHHRKLLERMIDEWQFAVSEFKHYAYAPYPTKLASLIEEAKDLPDGAGNYAGLYKRYRALRDQSQAATREGYSGPFRELQRHVPSGAVIRKLRYSPDVDLCLNKMWKFTNAGLLEEAYKALARFRTDFAIAKRDDVIDKSDYGKGLLRGENANFSWTNLMKQRYMDEYFPASSAYHRSDSILCFLRASIWYYIGYKFNEPVFAWLGARYLNQLKDAGTLAGIRDSL